MIGEKGSLLSAGDYGDKWRLLPKDKFEGFERPSPSLPRSPGHHREWINACKGGPAAMSNFEYSTRLTETVVLGNLALRSNQRIEWDAKKGMSKNMPVLNQYIARQNYREGFGIKDT